MESTNSFYKQSLLTIVIVLVLIGLSVVSGNAAKKLPHALNQPTTAVAPAIKTIRYKGEDGKTVLELLKQNNHTVVTQSTQKGRYVSSIDNQPQTSNSFWFYYIDGAPGAESADKMITKNNQNIEWRYESL